jgi:hypothetical protein
MASRSTGELALTVVARVLWGVLAFGLLLFGAVWYDFYARRDDYHFGTEIGGWTYKSESHYLFTLAVTTALISLGLLSGLVLKKPSRLIVLRVVFIALVLALNLLV